MLALRNLSFADVQHVKLITALKREAKFTGWLPRDVLGDDRYAGLQKLCNDIIQSVKIPLIRNDNVGAINGYGDTNLFFVADDQAWQTIRNWLHHEGTKRAWW